MNTHVKYIYRDASNYKAYPDSDIIIEGEQKLICFCVTVLRILRYAPCAMLYAINHMGEMFIPHDLDLPELQSQPENFPNPDEISGIRNGGTEPYFT